MVRFTGELAFAFMFICVAAGAAHATQASPLRIVVVAGEDSVNVIQQKTAVAPIVEVRDRNNQPVSGAVVTFAVQGGRAAAFQGGATTMTVATNAAGQAAATGLTPLTAGAMNISVEAAFQGQVVTAAISQVNVMTAAEAAAMAGGTTGAGASSTTGGGAAAGGGGLSGTTIGIIGGVAAAGAVAGTRVLGGDGGSDSISSATYSGPLTVNWTATVTAPTCTRQERYSGTLEIEIDEHESSSAAVTGTARVVNGVEDIVATTCPGPAQVGRLPGNWGMPLTRVTGTEAALVFQSQDSVNAIDNSGAIQRVFKFSGSLSGSTVTGTYEMTWQSPPIGTVTGSAGVTLTKR